MKLNRLIILLASLFVLACSSSNAPDVSNIKINVEIKRFDRDFFSIDTNNTRNSLDSLHSRYGDFLNDYLYNILSISAQKDSVEKNVKAFIKLYKPIYDSVQIKFTETKQIEKELQQALRYIKYYFPDYKAPNSITTFIGPFEGYGNILTNNEFAVGLQLYMGKDFSVYNDDYIRQVYPSYISQRFTPDYIVNNCIRNVIDDMYPNSNIAAPLIEQMVALGKRQYLLDKLLPDTEEYIKFGYTKKQLNACNENEAIIWSFYIKNDILYSTDPTVIRDYITDGPKTEAFGDDSPGAIGIFTGRQIVKKWMEKNPKTTLPQLMQTAETKIYEEAAYKPR